MLHGLHCGCEGCQLARAVSETHKKDCNCVACVMSKAILNKAMPEAYEVTSQISSGTPDKVSIGTPAQVSTGNSSKVSEENRNSRSPFLDEITKQVAACGTKHPKLQYHYICVIWTDASGIHRGSCSLEEIKETGLTEQHTVGFLVNETKDAIAIAQDIQKQEEEYDQVYRFIMYIPKMNLKTIIVGDRTLEIETKRTYIK